MRKKYRLPGRLQAALIMSLAASAAQAATLYVAPGGADGGACGSSASCKTTAYAIGKMADGDTLKIAPGTYADSTPYNCYGLGQRNYDIVIPKKNCVSGCTIEIQGAASSSIWTGGNAGLCVDDSDGWTIRGIAVEGINAIASVYSSNRTVIEDAQFLYYDIWSGKVLFIDSSTDVRVSRSMFENTVGCNVNHNSTGMLSVTNSMNVLFEQSRFGYDNSIGGIGSSENVTLRRNIFTHFTEHGVTLTQAPKNVLIENNIFRGDPKCVGTWNTCAENKSVGCTADSQCASYCLLPTGPRVIDLYEGDGVTVRNNTVVGHGYMWQHWFYLVYSLQNQASAGCTGGICDRSNIRVYNNLVYDVMPEMVSWVNVGYSAYTTQSGLSLDGNLYFKGGDVWKCWPGTPGDSATWAAYKGSSCWGGTGNMDPHGLNVEPTFANYAGQDYRPAGAASPQVNAGQGGLDGGVARCAAEDFAGNPRSDGSCDIGAFEFSGGGTPPPAPTLAFSASPASIAAGSSATLTWSATNATSCAASGAWSGAKAASGSQSVTPAATSTYTLTCTGSGGSAAKSASVTVTAAPPPPPGPPTPFSLLVQAEDMALIAPMTAASDAAALNGRYVAPTSGTDSTSPAPEAMLDVSAPSAGTYYLWARINGPTATSDALYVGIDGTWDRIYPSQNGAYEWVKVELTNGSGNYAFSLAAGAHTVRAGHGEIGARLDAMYLTNDPNAAPPQTIPLTDMGAQTYLGFAGGLYPNGNNAPADHDAAGLARAGAVVPLDANGNPSPAGKIVLLSVGMSNTTQEFCAQDSDLTPCNSWTFMGQAAADSRVNHGALVIVNGAKGGQDAGTWDAPADANYDRVRDTRLAPAGVSEKQVQAVWIKEADMNPAASLPSASADAYILETGLGNIIRALKVRYPNLRQAFLSSRIYAGYAAGGLNPEPYAYESGFSVKWAVQAQIDQMRSGAVADARAGDLNYDAAAPWLAWGPYLWANGTTPRSDGLIWQASDFESDGTHPAQAAEQKIGTMLLDFFLNSPYTKSWFGTRSAAPPAAPKGFKLR